MAFSMEISDPNEIKKAIEVEAKPVPEEVSKLQEIASANVQELLNVDVNSLEKKKAILSSIESFGMDTMQSSSNKNSLLKKSVGDFSKIGDDGGSVGKGLIELQKEIKNLDPSMVDFTKQGILGKLFNPARDYFAKYQKADEVIDDIISSLDLGKNTLVNDNTTLDIEQQALRGLTKKLNQEIELGAIMDEQVSVKLEEMQANNEDPEAIKFISEEVLFPLRQRIMDMQQMIVVNQQGIMAMEIIKRNNKELIRGVDRAKNVTVSAMRTAVIVAGALYNQKIVLDKINALNETTNAMISSTSRLLKEQGTEIQQKAIETAVSVDTLKIAFNDAIEAMDTISNFKREALPQMKQTILEFRELATQGEEQILRIEKGNTLSLNQ